MMTDPETMVLWFSSILGADRRKCHGPRGNDAGIFCRCHLVSRLGKEAWPWGLGGSLSIAWSARAELLKVISWASRAKGVWRGECENNRCEGI